MVEAPAALQAAGRVGCAEEGEDDGEEEQRRCAVVREVGETYGDGEGQEDEQAAADQGVTAEVEEISVEKVLVRLVVRPGHATGGVLHTLRIGACPG